MQRGRASRHRATTSWVREYVLELAAGVGRILVKNDDWLETGAMETWHDPTAEPDSTYAAHNMAPCVTVRATRTGRINSIG